MTNFSRVLPTTQVGYYAGTPIESSGLVHSLLFVIGLDSVPISLDSFGLREKREKFVNKEPGASD